MVIPLSEAANLHLYVRRGPTTVNLSFFRGNAHSVERFADAARARTNHEDLRALEKLVRVTLDLGGDSGGHAIGASLRYFDAGERAALGRLDEAGLVDIERGITDPNGHELDTAAFVSAELVKMVWDALPPSV